MKSCESCRWYNEAKPGGRKCYYGEPQCFRGWLSLMGNLFKLRFSRPQKAEQKLKEYPFYYPQDFRDIYSKTGKVALGNDARISQTGSELVMIVNIPKALILHQYCKATLYLSAAAAECGVYKGGTALILANVLREWSTLKQLHLFDSFKGLPGDILPIDSPHCKGNFGDATIGILEQRLSEYDNYIIHPGYFSETLEDVRDVKFSFVHIDCDIYTSVRECTEFFYKRVVPGGVIIYDDYGSITTKGVSILVNEFYHDKPERLIILPTGQAIITKIIN